MQKTWYSANFYAKPVQSSKFCTSPSVGTWIWPCTFLPNLNRFTLELKKIYIFRRSSHTYESNVCSMKETNLQAQRAQRMPHFFKVEAATFTYIEILKILDKEFTIQFKPFNEQGWFSTSMLLASALHFTQAASKLSSWWTHWPAGRTGGSWWPGSCWASPKDSAPTASLKW